MTLSFASKMVLVTANPMSPNTLETEERKADGAPHEEHTTEGPVAEKQIASGETVGNVTPRLDAVPADEQAIDLVQLNDTNDNDGKSLINLLTPQV